MPSRFMITNRLLNSSAWLHNRALRQQHQQQHQQRQYSWSTVVASFVTTNAPFAWRSESIGPNYCERTRLPHKNSQQQQQQQLRCYYVDDKDDDGDHGLNRKFPKNYNRRHKKDRNYRYRFVDKVRLQATGGRGGRGCLSHGVLGGTNLHPDGGHGGAGGAVILVADDKVQSLQMKTKHPKAESGANGRNSKKMGRLGDNLVVRVPCGVVVRRFLDPGEEWDETTKQVVGATPKLELGRLPSQGSDYWNEVFDKNEEEEQDEVESTNESDGDMSEWYQYAEDAKRDLIDDQDDENESNDDDDDDDDDDDKRVRRRRKKRRKVDEQSTLENYEWLEETSVVKYGDEEWILTEGGGDSSSRSSSSNSMEDMDDRPKVDVADLDQPGAYVVVARGGRGGKGTMMYGRTHTRHRPHPFEMAHNAAPELGEVAFLELELKLIADIGLVGFPNAGKSSLLRAMSRATPKVAPYPFTTLHPLLGTIEYRDGFQIKAADIPGLIEGASEGRGCGHDFLRHIERTKALLYIVDLAGTDGRDFRDDFRILVDELGSYGNGDLLERRAMVVANKTDLLDPEQVPELLFSLAEVVEDVGIRCEHDVHGASVAVTGDGLAHISKSMREVVLKAEEDRAKQLELDSLEQMTILQERG